MEKNATKMIRYLGGKMLEPPFFFPFQTFFTKLTRTLQQEHKIKEHVYFKTTTTTNLWIYNDFKNVLGKFVL